MRISTLQEYALVGAGGAIGALARWTIGLEIPSRPSGLPVATLIVNLVGCALIGLAARRIGGRRADGGRVLWWFAVTGMLGGFTTFSSFAVESERLAANGRAFVAAGYVAATMLGGLGATLLTAGDAVAGDPDR